MPETIPTKEYQTRLIQELCELLRQVLGQEGGQELEAKLNELLSTLSSIQKMMQIHVQSLEEMLPRGTAIDQLIQGQIEIQQELVLIRENTSWTKQQLDLPALAD